MQVVRIYMNNNLRNYSHLIFCEKTREAIVIDPLDVDVILSQANQYKLNITTIVNTHEHFDHIEGNPGIVGATGAKIFAHKNAIDSIPNVYKGLSAGDVIEVGKNVKLKMLDTPGHTMAHLCLFALADEPVLFCGDTLFNASAGNCCYGGDVQKMYQTFVEQLAILPEQTSIYPGHDYIVNNLNFSLSVEPDNTFAKKLLAKVIDQTPNERLVTTLATEKKINPFFRLDNLEITNTLKDKFPNMSTEQESVFRNLRTLRDKWYTSL